MKKIVALVLSLVMVLGLATTAFGAVKVPQWITNAADGFDVFDGNNVKVEEGVMVEYHPAVAPAEKNEFYGNITYYTLDIADDYFETTEVKAATYTDLSYFVLVNKYEAGCIAIKSTDKKLNIGTEYSAVLSQSAPGAVYFLKPVTTVHYNWDAEKFADFGTKCGDMIRPTKSLKDVYATVSVYDWDDEEFDTAYALLKPVLLAVDEGADVGYNVLMDGVIYTVDEYFVPTFVKHAWVASEYAEKDGAVTKYTCSKCGVVGTAVTSPYLAPSDAKIEQLGNNLYVYFYLPVAADDATVTSPKTFDAGIAMYVGMSVMAAAGSAVVLKKKD